MEINDNFFNNIKNYYNLTLDNFNLINKQQEQMVEFFIKTQPDAYKDNLLKIYQEWTKNSEIALNDYKNMVLKGLDYIETSYKKAVDKQK